MLPLFCAVDPFCSLKSPLSDGAQSVRWQVSLRTISPTDLGRNHCTVQGRDENQKEQRWWKDYEQSDNKEGLKRLEKSVSEAKTGCFRSVHIPEVCQGKGFRSLIGYRDWNMQLSTGNDDDFCINNRFRINDSFLEEPKRTAKVPHKVVKETCCEAEKVGGTIVKEVCNGVFPAEKLEQWMGSSQLTFRPHISF